MKRDIPALKTRKEIRFYAERDSGKESLSAQSGTEGELKVVKEVKGRDKMM